MIRYVIDENFLEQLSPTARLEVCRLIEKSTRSLLDKLHAKEWFPDRGQPFPLTQDQADKLLRALNETGRKVIAIFLDNVENGTGYASLEDLERVTGILDQEELNREIGQITQVLHRITGRSDAWLLDWNMDDWEFEPTSGRYTRGLYRMTGAAVVALGQSRNLL